MRNKKNITKNKFLIFLIFFAALLFLGANFVSALTLEVPSLKVSCPDSGSCLPQYVSSIFSWAISIAGVLSLISFIVGAVGLIISGDNPTLHGDSIDRMKGAVIGLALTLCSLLILTTINPVFKNPTLTPLPAAPTIAMPIITGVFYYTQPGCAGDSSGPNTSSQNHIDSAFAGKIKSIKIINDPAKDIYYGAIFHATPGLENAGDCSSPIVSTTCSPVNVDPFAADIFKINKTPNTSGTGVTFYSEAYGWTTGMNAGSKVIKNTDIIPANDSYTAYAASMRFDYTGVNRPDVYKHKCDSSKSADAIGNRAGIDCSEGACETFKDCPGSIKINGKYLVYLSVGYATFFCHTFTEDVESLDSEQIGGESSATGEKLTAVSIIPIE